MKYDVFLLIVVRDMYDTYSTAPFTTEEGEGSFYVSVCYLFCIWSSWRHIHVRSIQWSHYLGWYMFWLKVSLFVFQFNYFPERKPNSLWLHPLLSLFPWLLYSGNYALLCFLFSLQRATASMCSMRLWLIPTIIVRFISIRLINIK